MLERGQVETGPRGKGTSGRSWWHSPPRSRSERRKGEQKWPWRETDLCSGTGWLSGAGEGRHWGGTEAASPARPRKFHSAEWFTMHTSYLCCITSYPKHRGLKQHVSTISQFTVESLTVQRGLTSLKPRSRPAGSSSGGSVRKRCTSAPSGWMEFISCGCVTEVPVAGFLGLFFFFFLPCDLFGTWVPWPGVEPRQGEEGAES